MSSIRLTETPPGFAPEHIRKQWMGIELPLAHEEEIAQYLVLPDKAKEALRAAGREMAANYWDSFPLGRFLRFKKDICKLVA